MVETRRIALTDPFPSTPARFVVGGQVAPSSSGDVSMYQWRPNTGKMTLIALQPDVGQVRAMGWAPFPHQRTLIACGLTTGRTLLLNLTPSTLSQPMNPSSSLPSAVGTLPAHYSRSVTALAFSKIDPNYLAVGYERHRSDDSLHIWDISTSISPLPSETSWTRPADRLEGQHPTPREGTSKEPRSVLQFCKNELIISVAFQPDTINHLLTSTNSRIRLHDLRSPSTQNQGSGSPTWLTRTVYGLCPDPHSPRIFASFENLQGSGLVRLWDSRKVGVEMMSLEVGQNVQALEWTSRGLAVGTRQGGVSLWDVVSGKTEHGRGTKDWVTLGSTRQIIPPKGNLNSFAFTYEDTTPTDVLYVLKEGTLGIGPVGGTPIISSSAQGALGLTTRKTLRVVDPHSNAGQPEEEPEISPARRDSEESADFEDYKRSNRFQLAPEGVARLLAEAADRSASRASSPGRSSLLRSTQPASPRELTFGGGSVGGEVVGRHEEILGGYDGLRKVLKGDVMWTMRRRAAQGYGLQDLLLNGAIAIQHPGKDRLSGIWEFVNHLLQIMPPSTSTHRAYNLTYHGISSIWSGPEQSPSSPSSIRTQATLQNEPRPHRQTSAAWSSLANHQGVRQTSVPTHTTERIPRERVMSEVSADYTAAVVSVLAQRQQNGLGGLGGKGRWTGFGGGVNTERGPQRRLMMMVCGEDRNSAMAEVNRLVEDSQRTKAACWAYFAGEESKAMSILLNSPNEKHRLMGSTMAGFISQSRAERGSEFWQEHWQTMVTKTDDPYVRVILSRIGGDGWDSVLKEEAIPLLDRVSIAINNLSDRELSAFFKDRYSRCLLHCSLHGLVLTGFTPPAIPLLQAYLDRTGDLQTVSILSTFFPPSRLSRGERKALERWQEAYRELLDRWKMYDKRCGFDVGRQIEMGRLGEEIKFDKRVCPM
ncbi:hypothetical protein M231_02025 [Tremella mesenterica]|uniref:MIOS-like alpha-solenoid domain-containing protein n=1 Tax=Tremella mesenterica TaxID=5217 RepID=A0A4Q1BS09_TREME|nr:hypothetical protein M231_02025 [Tremella mesenterica]